MKDSDSAFPVFDSARGEMDYQCIDPGLTAKQYAAIHLKVPRSGDPDIDAMILENRRDEFAKAAMTGIMSIPSGDVITKKAIICDARICYAYADAMLAEMEKGAE
jgi:hypothetical protein